MAQTTQKLPRIVLNQGAEKRLRLGHPWVFSNELAPKGTAGDEREGLAAGALVTAISAEGRGQGTFFYAPQSLISLRLVSRENDTTPDAEFWNRRLTRALALRQALLEPEQVSWCRLAHGEADGFPGATLDRFGDDFVLRTESAGMERQRAPLLEALCQVFSPRAVVARDDSSLRALEDLPLSVSVPIGDEALPEQIAIPEGKLSFLTDLRRAQKSGWFYDQRPQRLLVAQRAKHRRVLDLCTGLGGFALHAAAGGATSVLAVDTSAPALALARASAQAAAQEDASLSTRLAFDQGEARAVLDELIARGEKFDLVISDPPAFAPRRKDKAAALRAYRALTARCARVAAKDGLLLLCSCSHPVAVEEFESAVVSGLASAERAGRIVGRFGAGADHPTLAALPQSAYLKALLIAV